MLILLAGLSLVLYPTFADWWNSFHQSRAIAQYDEKLANMEPEDFSAFFEEAKDYNDRLAQADFPLRGYDKVTGYRDALNVTGDGIMGYIEILKINVQLPIYHGTSEGVLQVAVGHVEGSSLPTGGMGNHCVLSAHRGLPSARLFTDLDELQTGDLFVIRVLDELLTYEVDQILIVEPHEVDALRMEKDKDLCTLVTCTPYGINTHRLLVRGHRVENTPEAERVRVTADAMKIEPLYIAVLLFVPLLTVLIGIAVSTDRRKKKN